MTEKEKIEGYLINLDITFEEVAKNTWVISDHDKGLEQVMIIAELPVVILRVKVMDTSDSMPCEFYKELLSLNASDLVHGAYALDGNDVVLVDTHEFEHLDFEELQASLDAISLALAQHFPVLSKYLKK
jgi:hypothetical protein